MTFFKNSSTVFEESVERVPYVDPKMARDKVVYWDAGVNDPQTWLYILSRHYVFDFNRMFGVFGTESYWDNMLEKPSWTLFCQAMNDSK